MLSVVDSPSDCSGLIRPPFNSMGIPDHSKQNPAANFQPLSKFLELLCVTSHGQSAYRHAVDAAEWSVQLIAEVAYECSSQFSRFSNIITESLITGSHSSCVPLSSFALSHDGPSSRQGAVPAGS